MIVREPKSLAMALMHWAAGPGQVANLRRLCISASSAAASFSRSGMPSSSISCKMGLARVLRHGMLVFMVLLLNVSVATAVPVISDDVLALLVFKAGVVDPTEALSSWNDQDSTPCNWTGIVCNTSSDRVTEIKLNGLLLSGTIGRALVKVEQLQTLDLSRNNLSGVLDGEIALIANLREVNVSYNFLSGSIPSEFGSAGNLYSLDLSNNAFSGTLPPELFSFSCQALQHIDVSGNLLNGPIPASIGSCLELQNINFSSNLLAGGIPDGIWALEHLLDVDLSYNFLSGGIPVGVGFLTNLTSFRLQSNNLSGEVPSELGNCVLLQNLVLSDNHFSGQLPPQLDNLRGLSVLNVAGNSLEGGIPAWLANMTTLTELTLAGNFFQGQIPSFVSNLGQLQLFNVSENNLTGPIPTQLSQLKTLQEVDLSNNFFTGLVPDFSASGCPVLQSLLLSGNRLSGTVPSSLATCSNLEFLSLAGNSLASSVPPELGSLSSLAFLDLGDNDLIGPIPSSLGNASRVRTLRLGGNSLNGTVPSAIGNFVSLVELNLSRNNLTGPIPTDLGRLDYLEYLDLSYNIFSGEIPDDLGQLQNLQLINVSHNQLQGPIPTDGIFLKANTTAFGQNSGLCGAPLNLSCSPTFPDPLVIDPNSPDSIPGTLTPLLRSKRSQTILSVSAITAISAAAAIALGVIMVTLLNMYAQTRQRSNVFTADSDPQSPSAADMAMGKLVMFTRKMDPKSDEWMASTHAILNKDCEIGRGGFGTVFKAVLAHGETVAVKKLMVGSLVKTQTDFETVVHMLGNVKHPNLVELQGYYWTDQLQLLVYDYLPNGNLYSLLHERSEDKLPLSWPSRFRIALGTALGLAHLHHGCIPALIHYDVKSSNVLLDEDYEAQLSDYSLAKLLPRLDSYVMSSKMQSALGYMAPEFACQSLKITEKCDVYGFGVLLLELVTGRRPVEYMEDDVVILCDYVRALLDEGRALTCVDSKLHGFPEDEVLPIIKLGLICTSQVPSNRPSMGEVVQILELIRPLVESRGP